MPRTSWLLYHPTLKVWLTREGTHAVKEEDALHFTTYDRAERFLKRHAPDFVGAWTITQIIEAVKR